ncbi:MAG: hypothetical protein HQK79_07255 [Desulfobacterales bacterium]|nr:hypothetical protein [Desulfobacterales bacterium]
MENLTKIKELVQDAVDKGATSVEQVHLMIANLPFDILDKVNMSTPATEKVQRFQERTIGNIYDLIRTLNKKVGEIATEILQK